jgi:2-methylcitrate dehydratase PrpD
MVNALGIVYSSVAGNHQVTRDASLMKRVQPGLAAQAAVVAVQLAQRGIRGPQLTFEGIDGFFRVYLHDRCDGAIVRKGLGRDFELLNLSYKPYPCCRYNHTAVDAMLQARATSERPASDIRAVRVGVTAQCYEAVCTPEAVRRSPRTIVEAQFSIPYTVACAWIDGSLGLGHFTDEALQRSDILDLAARVHPYVDAKIERDWSRSISPAALHIEFRDGRTLEVRADYPKGHPRNPMTPADFAAKVSDCAAFTARPLRTDTAQRLTDTVGALDSLPDISVLVDLLT